MPSLTLGVLAAAGWSVVALGGLQARSRSFGRRTFVSRPARSARPGIVYAFSRGMAPGAKESAREHLPIWFAGVAYHLGVFAAFVYLALLLARVAPDGTPAGFPGLLQRGLQALLAVGVLGGAVLFGRRVAVARLRGLSTPDDYISNLLVTAFLVLSVLRTILLAVEPVLLAETIVLLVWIPFGKIRHCVFFFTSRYHQANHFGRRGVFPPAHAVAAADRARPHG